MESQSLSLPVLLPAGGERIRTITRLQDGLLHIKGVYEVSLNNALDTLNLVYDPNLVTFSRLQKEARRMGAEVVAVVDHVSIALDNLNSPDNIPLLERALRAEEGVIWAGANFASAHIHIEFLRNTISIPALLKKLGRFGVAPRLLGADASTNTAETKATGHASSWNLFQALPTLIAALLTLLGFLTGLSNPTNPLSRGLYVAAVIAGSVPMLVPTFWAALNRSLDRNGLILLTVAFALALRSWGEAAALMVLFGVSNLLPAVLLKPTRTLLQHLTDTAPTQARVRREESEPMLSVYEVTVGDLLIVEPGETIPLDSVVLTGASLIEELPLVGEPRKVEKTPGAVVFAGTRNTSGKLFLQVMHTCRDSLLHRMAQRLEEALAQHAPAERNLMAFSHKLTRLLCALAIVLAVVPPYLESGMFLWNFADWGHRALAVLVVANLSAFALATPVAIVTALTTALRHGSLIKGGFALDVIGAMRAIVYDKTGTLTQGKPTIDDIVPFGSMTCAQVVSLAAAMEQDSQHPIAQAMRQATSNYPPTSYEISGATEIAGQGIRAFVNGVPTLLGSVRLFQSQKVALPRPAQEKLTEAEARGNTVVLLGSAYGLYGLLLLSDPPRPEVRGVVAELQKMGVLYQALLTGDNTHAAAQVAGAVGLAQCEGNLLPDQRGKHIETLQARYGQVAMVGGGTNDAPALGTADVNVAMGAMSNEVTLDVADVALLREDLSTLPFLVRLSRQTQNILRWNTTLVMVLQAVLLALALGTKLPLGLFLLADILATAGLIAQGLRLHESLPIQVEVQVPPPLETTLAPLLELVFINDSTVDEQPILGYVYPSWETFVIPFTGDTLRFGRKYTSSALPIQIEDEGMSRLHGEIRVEGKRPVIVDLQSTNGIRRNGITLSALIAPERPIPIQFGDVLRIGRNTRVEVREPLETPPVPSASGKAVVNSTLIDSPNREPLSTQPESRTGKSSIDRSATQDLSQKFYPPLHK